MILSVRLWGPGFTSNRISIYCNIDAVCDTIFHQKPKDPVIQQLLREFLYWVCCFNFIPLVEKIGTKDNFIADFISRNTSKLDIDEYFSSLNLPKQND